MASLRPVLNKQHRRNTSNSTEKWNNHGAAFGNNKFRVRTFRASATNSSGESSAIQCDSNTGGSSKKTPSSTNAVTGGGGTNLTEIKLVKYPFMQVRNELFLFVYLY